MLEIYEKLIKSKGENENSLTSTENYERQIVTTNLLRAEFRIISFLLQNPIRKELPTCAYMHFLYILFFALLVGSRQLFSPYHRNSKILHLARSTELL